MDLDTLTIDELEKRINEIDSRISDLRLILKKNQRTHQSTGDNCSVTNQRQQSDQNSPFSFLSQPPPPSLPSILKKKSGIEIISYSLGHDHQTNDLSDSADYSGSEDHPIQSRGHQSHLLGNFNDLVLSHNKAVQNAKFGTVERISNLNDFFAC
ncbi:hypothetical protein TRFO_41135 [Tritrichomonas foetus]|uniref:Uncharacterized protein n=1 Tax=Tritrichomonas foetus TaxID=1144522 RepID=A0A1J4L5R1_9EUKA|nr:hypothetical protein TRFO_41135 [Tritrichomonas foetus]|eukprot:OHT17286.1 hypothetical protein TRFO_41135 [Tritrichomonas foetus]